MDSVGINIPQSNIDRLPAKYWQAVMVAARFKRKGKAMKTLKNDTILLVAGGNLAGYGVGFVPEGFSERKETGGPLIPGPWAYSWARASVMDNHGGTGAELEKLQEAGRIVKAKAGETVKIDGRQYTIRLLPDRVNIEFVPATSE